MRNVLKAFIYNAGTITGVGLTGWLSHAMITGACAANPAAVGHAIVLSTFAVVAGFVFGAAADTAIHLERDEIEFRKYNFADQLIS